jgi:hypothetical protein
MEVVLVQVLEVDVVAEVIGGVSKVVVVKEVSIVNLDYISITHLLALRDDNVLEIIVAPKKRNYVEFERWTGLIDVKSIAVMCWVIVAGNADLEVVRFVVYSILQFRWLYLFQSPKNEELEDFCAVHFQQLPEVDVELVVALGGLGVRAVLVEEIVVLVWLIWLLRRQQKFSLCLV